MNPIIVPDKPCRGILLAGVAATRSGRMPHLQMDARLRLGAFAFPLPEQVPDAMRKTNALFALAMELDPREFDAPPVIETRYGPVPVDLFERCKQLEALAERHDDPDAVNLRRTAAALELHCRGIAAAWDQRRQEVWEALYEAELIATERLYTYLIANLAMVHEERERYRSGRDNVGAELVKAALRVHAARKQANVSELETAELVVGGVALLLTIGAIAGSLGRNDLGIDDAARAEMAEAAKLQDEAQRQRAEGVTEYLTVLRREAERFPVLLIIDHTRRYALPSVLEAAFDALDRAEQAITALRRAAVRANVVRDVRVPELGDMAQRMARADRASVWKLPFFLDRALLELPPADANAVRQMRRLGAELDGSRAIAHAIAFGGVDAVMLPVAFAGPVGVCVALCWAVLRLAQSVHDYGQLQDLFAASIDPSLLLRGLEHGPASRAGIVLDLLGLLV